jgi:hypothetical protein
MIDFMIDSSDERASRADEDMGGARRRPPDPTQHLPCRLEGPQFVTRFSDSRRARMWEVRLGGSFCHGVGPLGRALPEARREGR